LSICYRDASAEVLFNLSNRHADTVAKAKRTLLSVSCLPLDTREQESLDFQWLTSNRGTLTTGDSFCRPSVVVDGGGVLASVFSEAVGVLFRQAGG
jgi:hypothetical protein